MSLLQDLPALLRGRSTRSFLLARFLSVLGWQMLAVAVGWHVYALTHDPFALGIVGLSEFLPFFLLVLYGGHVADRVSRRKVVMLAYSATLLSLAVLLALALAGLSRAWPVYACICVFGAARAFWAPAMQATLPLLVPRERLTGAMAVSGLMFQAAVITGPTLGGLLYLGGPQAVYGTALLLFSGTVLLVGRIRLPVAVAVAGPREGAVRSVVEGLRHVLHTRVLLGALSLDLFAVLFGGAAALLPVFADQVLHTGPAGLGLLRSAAGIGAACAGGWLALRPLRDHAGRWLLGSVAVFGACMVVFGLSASFVLSFAALLVGGAADMVSVYIRAVLVQLATPEHIRGRVSSVSSMFIGASNELGAFESGLTASWLGTIPSVVGGGLLTLVIAGSWAWLFPPLRRLRHLR
jgi:MFS family permease